MNAAMQPAWPVKQRETVEWVYDSRPWNDLNFRDGDIVVCTWSKSVTTWMQQILAQLILGADPEVYGPDLSPLTLPPTLIQRDGDSGGWFGRSGGGERRGLVRSLALSAAPGPVAG